MLKSQAATLNKTGLSLLEKAEACTKASDVTQFTELGLKCLAESRDIIHDMKHNTVLIFIECCAHLGAVGNYGDYLDFCARNSLDILSEVDFGRISKDILTSI